MSFQMDLKTVLLILGGGITGLVGTTIAVLTYRRSRIRELPVLRLDSSRILWRAQSETLSKLPTPEIKLTNTGAGLARKLNVSIWIFMVTESRFVVPSDSELPPHFTATLDSLKPGETVSPLAFRSGIPPRQSNLPQYDDDAVPFTKVSITYCDVFGKSYVERFARAGKPTGFEVGGVESRDE